MKIITNKINNSYLQDILRNIPKNTKQLKIAMAYADSYQINDKSVTNNIIEVCKDRNIKLSFYGRKQSESERNRDKNNYPIDNECIKKISELKSSTFKFVKNLHAKVFYFQGYGVYIGSANFTYNSWKKNIEFGIWLEHKDLNDFKLSKELNDFFEELDREGKVPNWIDKLSA